uniref:Uncharacterized protein n=1 Tax=Macaca fascicularis TaxID=9541 RepID=Q9BGY4_MACFA|nr:hypothetical protein [Macaca fascicularis]
MSEDLRQSCHPKRATVGVPAEGLHLSPSRPDAWAPQPAPCCGGLLGTLCAPSAGLRTHCSRRSQLWPMAPIQVGIRNLLPAQSSPETAPWCG